MRRSAHQSGFTLMELLVVVLVIAILMAVLLVAVLRAGRGAQRVADLQAARAMDTAATQFKTDNGFEVPLVFDGAPLAAPGFGLAPPQRVRKSVMDGVYGWDEEQEMHAPVLKTKGAREVKFVAVYDPAADLDFFRGGKDASGSKDVVDLDFGPGGLVRDGRYSKFSLPIYLAGVYGKSIDGVEGPGLTQPLRDGTFAGIVGRGAARPVDAYVDPTQDLLQIEPTYADRLEAMEMGAGQAQSGRPYTTAFVDRYERAFRYYRWEPGRNTRDAAATGDVGLVTRTTDLNVPYILQDFFAAIEAGSNEDADVLGGSAELRGATSAIVGAGPDGLFGTEPMSELDPAGAAQTPEQVAAIRQRYAEDNVVVLRQ